MPSRIAVQPGKVSTPFAGKVRSTMPTFAQAATSTLEANRDRWAPATLRTWIGPLEKHANPTIGRIPVGLVTRQDVLAVLTPIWNAKPAEARKVRKRIRTVLDWAVAHGHCDRNIAANGEIDGALPNARREVGHHAALPFAELPAAFAELPDGVAGDCLRFLILTVARSAEARGADWTEIDMDAREWRIPADRMKSRREHRVPLSDASCAILERQTGRTGLVFASPKTGRAMHGTALGKLAGKLGATVHGFRSAFRDWAAESPADYDHAVIEMSLAHAAGSAVERAYRRSDLVEKRRALMDDWARYLAA